MRRVESRLGLGPVAKPVSEFVDLNDKGKEDDAADMTNSEESNNLRRIVRTAMEKRQLEKKLELLMKKKKGIHTLEEDEVKQIKKRQKVDLIPGTNCQVPNFELFIPVFSIPEKTNKPDWQTKIEAKSAYEKRIKLMFTEPSFESVFQNQLAIQAAIATSLCVVQLAAGMLSGSIFENIMAITEPESNPTPISRLHAEVDELIFHRNNLTNLINSSLHGADAEPGLLEEAILNLEASKNLVSMEEVINEGDLIISEIIKPQALHVGASFWGVYGCSEFSLEMAGTKLCPSDDLFATFRQTFLPDHEYVPPLHGAAPDDFGTLKQNSKARAPCRNDFAPGRCNSIPCTFLHEHGHSSSEYLYCKKILTAVGCMPQVLKSPSLQEDLNRLRNKFLEAFYVCRDNPKNSSELRSVLEEVLHWIYYKLGGSCDTITDNAIDWSSEGDETSVELTAAEQHARDLAWNVVLKKIHPLHDVAFKQLQAKYPDSEEIAAAIASVRMSCLPPLSLSSLKVTKLSTKIDDRGQVIRLDEFETSIQQYPCCLPLYILYVESIARLGEPKLDTLASIVSVLTTGLNHCAAFSLTLSDDDPRKAKVSFTMFSLILFVTFIRMADSSAVKYLKGLMSSGTTNLEKILLPQHYGALPIIFASCVAGVFPKTMARVWPLTNGLPLVLEWTKISNKEVNTDILFYYKLFIDSKSWSASNSSSRECLLINKCWYIAACGNPTAAVSELVKSCATDPQGPSISLFKALADIQTTFKTDIAAGFDSFRLYEGISGGGTPEWNGVVSLLHINLLLRHGSVAEALDIASQAETFASPYKEISTCISCLLRGDTAAYLAAIKLITDGEEDVHPQILAEILKFQGDVNLVNEFASESIKEQVDKVRTPGTRYGDWHILNLLDLFYSDSQSLIASLQQTEGTRVAEAIDALRGGDAFPEGLLFTDLATHLPEDDDLFPVVEIDDDDEDCSADGGASEPVIID
eukprot:TRINITY_DN2223_c2_g1_i1.p1 TRINITY_DN2223_c2_g1~~TRINITY_DN2223_c2_g1_i1.p1  ORF type:complete len:977 (+),score=162.42 TRINITY_DN2223_c2_g1_i1:47-2977(+)